ncbi:MAG TPA: hypothetical protein VHH11_01610 [Gammaproteobacteria bacterium]|jgi:hypothetical protein|nr:hypothetical protein [Gammaproteobacteria bacterium]
MESADKKAVVSDFLRRCNRYAEDRLAKYRRELATADAAAALAIQDKIGHWTAYRAFNEHALTEIDRGELDDWFA